jgi:predicted dehydrogenase
MVGFGFIAENGHLPAYLGHAGDGCALEIVAVADICEQRRERARSLLPDARVYEDARALVAKETDLDFLDVATPPSEHATLTHLGLDRGLHVLCEKPLATVPADARAMLEHAQRAKRVVYPCHNYKHAPVIRAVRHALDEGAIGDVRLVTLQTFRDTHAKGVRDWRTDWRRERRWSGGGIAMDHGSHTFYLAFDWLGAFPSAITAKMSQAPGYDTEDNFTCTMSFPNGAVASAHLTWTAGVRRVLYTIHGTLGAIRVEDDEVEIAIRSAATAAGGKSRWEIDKQHAASAWMDAGHAGWFASMFREFAAAIDQGDFVGQEAESSLRCVELISTAYASARQSCRELPLPADRLLVGSRGAA